MWTFSSSTLISPSTLTAEIEVWDAEFQTNGADDDGVLRNKYAAEVRQAKEKHET